MFGFPSPTLEMWAEGSLSCFREKRHATQISEGNFVSLPQYLQLAICKILPSVDKSSTLIVVGSSSPAIPDRRSPTCFVRRQGKVEVIHMLTVDVGVGHRGSRKCWSAWPGRYVASSATAAFVDGRGSRLAAGRTSLGGAGAPAVSGSRSWCRRRGGRARPWRPACGRWLGRRRAAARTAPAGPRAAGPSPRRARSPLDQRIEHRFERGSGALRSPTGPLGAWRGSRWVSTTCQQVVSSDPMRGLTSPCDARCCGPPEQG
jgi:hypothetical protein